MHAFSPISWFILFPNVFRWWFILLIIGWISFPLIYLIFRKFKDRGFPLSKIFAAVFIGYSNWILTWFSSKLHIPVFQNNFISIGLGLLLLTAVNFMIFQKHKKEIISFIRKKRNYIVLTEVIFLLVFLFFIRVRSFVPEAQFDPMKSGAEKFLNFQVLNSIMQSKTFPPPDGWMAGKAIYWTFDEITKEKKDKEGNVTKETIKKDHPRTFYINYYYFGHLIMGTLGKLSFYSSEYVFNLGLATLIGFTSLAAFCLAYNLSMSLLLAFFGMFAVAFFGNLDAFVQYLEKLGMGVRGDDAFWGIDFWRSSRMFKGTITEFPYFSIILGDFHAHNLNIPNFLFLASLILNLLYIKPSWEIDFEKKITFKNLIHKYGLIFIFMGFFWGMCYLTNSWDVINCTILISLSVFYFYYIKSTDIKILTTLFSRFIVSCFFIGVVMLITISFFQIFFEKPIDTEGFPFKWLPANLRTKFPYYLSHHFIFLIPIIIYLIVIFKRTFFNDYLKKYNYVILRVLFGVLILSVNWLGFWMPSFAIVLMLCSIIFLLFRNNHISESAAFIFLTVSFFISFACDVWYLDDRYSGDLERYNTVFKFYYPIWGLLAMASVIAFRQLFLWTKKKIIITFLIYLLLAFLSFLGFHYPLASTVVRTSVFQRNSEGKLIFEPIRGSIESNKPPLSINAIEYIGENPKFKDDFEIIKYIKKNIKTRDVILESPPDSGSGAYSPVSRIATTTGLRTIIGWSHHEAQHRGGKSYAEIGPREQDMKKAFNSPSWEEAKDILNKYNVKYIIIGALEREYFSQEGLLKFEQNCKLVYKSNDSALYEYNK